MDFDYALLAKYLVDELTPEELEEVMKWRSLSAANEAVHSELVKLRLSWKLIQYNRPETIEKALGVVNAKISRSSKLRLFRSAIQYAAVILLLVSFSYVGWNYSKSETYVTIVVKQGEDVKKMTLDDGSTVWLRGNSVLKIPESFSASNRSVSLQGEAFFDIAKNAQFPFYVSTEYLNIKVLGTTFNVKTDENRKKVETVLARGQVALLNKQWNTVLDMSPGEKVTYRNLKNEYATEIVDVNICTAWRLNQFVFENVTLREIVNQLSVKFNVNINLESSKLAQRRFRCVINEDESLPDILKLLGYLAPIQYRIEGREIFIYE